MSRISKEVKKVNYEEIRGKLLRWMEHEGMKKHAWCVGGLAKRPLTVMEGRELDKLVRPEAREVKGVAGVGSGPISYGGS